MGAGKSFGKGSASSVCIVATMASIDPTALSQWFETYAKALVLYARQWLDGSAAEDMVQEVFARLMAQRRLPDNPKAWLFRSVRNASISELRVRQRRRKYEERMGEGQAQWFEDRPDALIDGATAESALGSLDDEDREIVVLRIWGGLTLREIAETVDQPVSTVFHRYQSGLGAIRKRLESSCRTKMD